MWGDSRFSREVQRDVHRTRPTNVVAPVLTWHSAFYLPHGIREHQAAEVLSNELIVDHSDRYGAVSQLEEPRAKQDKLFVRRELDNFFLKLYEGLNKDGIRILPGDDRKIVLFNDVYERGSDGGLTRQNVPANAHSQNDLCATEHGEYPVVRAKFPWNDLLVELRCELLREYFTFTIYVSNIRCSDVNRVRIDNLRQLALRPDGSISASETSESLYKTFWKEFEIFIVTKCEGIAQFRDNIIFQNIFADFRGVVLAIDPEKTSDLPPESLQYLDWEKVSQNLIGFVTEKDEFECIASHMLGKKVLYMSDLGQRRLGNVGERIPVTFLVCLKGVDHGDGQTSQFYVNKWQLGRLVDRLNFLGTVRLAALRDLSLVLEASRSLAAFEPIMKKAEEVLQLDVVDTARAYFRSIAGNFQTRDTTKQGLQYRIERSRYYISRFEKNIPLLRISRIEGYQSYDQFVERRIGASFDFIDRVGVRYERARSSLSLLDQNYLAKNLENIQEWADLALIGFLIPYYGYSLLHHLLPRAADGLRHWALLVWVLAVAFASFRFFGLSKTVSRENVYKCIIMIGFFLIPVGFALHATDDFRQLVADPVKWLMCEPCGHDGKAGHAPADTSGQPTGAVATPGRDDAHAGSDPARHSP